VYVLPSVESEEISKEKVKKKRISGEAHKI